jgi:NDP-sugar pyrophosphorylase family protein
MKEPCDLKAGIIAAGRGERLRTRTNQLKPLVRLRDRTLIEHVLTSMAEAGVSEIAVIINEESLAVRERVTSSRWPFTLHWIVETTPSSMESFLRVIETLAADGSEGPFLVSTVDTIASPQTYRQFVFDARRHEDAAVVLALTFPGSDEKPLLVRMVPDKSKIVAIGQAAAPSDLATAGLYFVNSCILRESESARQEGVDALRTFLGRLLENGYYLAGVPISKAIDVDRPADITAAEEFLRTIEA